MRTWSRSVPRFLIVVISSLLSLFAVHWGVRAYVGEITYDGLVDGADLAVIEAAFGSKEWSGDPPTWNAEADLNEDDRVDIMDLAIAGRSYGSDRNLHQARRLANGDNTTNRLDACLDGLGRLHVVWSEYDWRSVFYTRLDRYGNTLVDDVLVDEAYGTGEDLVAVGCDAEGDAHLIWDCGGDVCQARFDRWGYQTLPKTLVDDRPFPAGAEGSVGLDSQSRAHVLYRYGSPHRLVYAMLTGEGEKAVSIEDPLIADVEVSRYRQLAVDGSDNVYLLWSEEEGVDRLFYARLGADADTSIPATVVGLPQWDGSVTSAHRPSLALDGQGNAFVLWNGGVPTQLYLDKIDPDGDQVLDDYLIFPEWHLGHYQDLAIGPGDRLHLLAPTEWGRSVARSAYGNFDNSAQPLYPMRWVLYGWMTRDPHLLVDAQDDLHLVYRPESVTADDPPCPSMVLCYQSTAFDAVAYDRTRPDLGVDVAHLDWAPVLGRWGQSLAVTATVFNAGWTGSPATTAHFEVLASDETSLDPPIEAQVAIAALAPRQTQQVSITLSLSITPPPGYETLEYARLEVLVDPTGAIAETTEENNRLAAPLMIQPLPTHAGLFLMVKDVTPTSRGGDAVPLKTGDVHLTGPGISRSVEVDDYITVLDDLPIGATPVTYTVSWAAAASQEAGGYRVPAAIEIGIGRNAVDPYQVDYSPGNTALFETDTWGHLSGVLTASDTGDPLSGATVRVQGQGLGLQVTTDGAGAFSSSTEPLLGQLPAGDYTIYASAAGYARISDQVNVPSLGLLTWEELMDPTIYAYVRGSVINQYGRPVANAQLDACGITGQSVSDGSFDLGEVPAACASLEVDKAGYATVNESLALSAGLEAYLPDITLSFYPPLSVVQDEGGMASWYQDESSADLLPDPPDDATWAQEQLFGTFSDKFWPSYRVQVWWGCYEFAVDAAYSGPEADRHLAQVQVRLVPKSFEAHRVSGSGSVKVNGRSIKVNLGVFQDSGVTTALWVVEARLVNADTGEVIKTVRAHDGGSGSWIALQDTSRTYDFGEVTVDDWDAAEVWLYIKVGKNEGGEWTGSPILRGWHFDQQVLRLDLDGGSASGDFVIVDFPLP